jgi:hypothetical protein
MINKDLAKYITKESFVGYNPLASVRRSWKALIVVKFGDIPYEDVVRYIKRFPLLPPKQSQ